MHGADGAIAEAYLFGGVVTSWKVRFDRRSSILLKRTDKACRPDRDSNPQKSGAGVAAPSSARARPIRLSVLPEPTCAVKGPDSRSQPRPDAFLSTHHQTGGRDVLYVRPDAKFDKSKPISGGIPHCWPQFGPGAMQLHGALVLHCQLRTSGVLRQLGPRLRAVPYHDFQRSPTRLSLLPPQGSPATSTGSSPPPLAALLPRSR